MYNKNMMNDCNCYKSFTTTSEYPCKKPACIRKKQPDCMATAVIPAITVDTTTKITDLADCFVHVTSNNTTYYIDDKHRPMLVWAGPIETSTLAEAEALGLRMQTVYTTINGVYSEVYFDKLGTAHIMGTEA